MAYIPESVRAAELIERLTIAGLNHLNSGKTGELFQIPDSDYLLMAKTDRVSIFDFVLPGLVPDKGAILTQMTILWITKVLGEVTDQFAGHHLSTWGKEIGWHTPKTLTLDADLLSRSLVIERFNAPHIECIVRGYLTGSGFKDYDPVTGLLHGHRLRQGLKDGDRLGRAIFTPSTKALQGHDENIDYLEVRHSHGTTPERVSLALYRRAAQYARRRGFIIADTKFELGPKGELIDEVLTPDSSRFWLLSAYEAAQAKEPPTVPAGFDKQSIRNWGKTVSTPFHHRSGAPIVGINNLDPQNPAHVEFVSGLVIPTAVLDHTSELYHQCLERLFGVTLKECLQST